MSKVFSSPQQLQKIATVLSRYMRLPVSTDCIPGAFLEAVLAHARDASRLNTYDYVDVIHRGDRVGWSIKSTKATTPVTWKRAKIPSQLDLIKASRTSAEGLQALGDAIIEFCNSHARASVRDYNLNEIGYSRAIVLADNSVKYFERKLCDRDRPNIFDPSEFVWGWSIPKQVKTKEQLPALHGTHVRSGKKWWAWHGLGENQLHFSGESAWWPNEDDPHQLTFKLPTDLEKISFDQLTEILESL